MNLNKNSIHKKPAAIIIGIILVATGILINEWTLAYFLSDGKIESTWKGLIIWGFDLISIALGYLIIRNAITISYKNILVTVFSFLITFLVAELFFRLFYPFVSPVDELFVKSELFVPKPYVMYGGKPNYDKLNSLGYVEDAPQHPKPAKEFRVFILGGSTVYAGKPTISKLLEREFHANGFSNVKCFNWGVPASTSGMELSRIVHEISDRHPDLIIMYNGGNDLMINLWADPRPGYPFNYFIYESNPLLEREVGDYPMVNLMLYESKMLRHFFPAYFIKVFTKYNQRRKEVNYGEQSWEQEIVNTYVNNIIKARKISNSIDSDFVVFFQPLVYFKDNLTNIERQSIQKTGLNNYINQMHGRVFDKINSIKTSQNFHMIDLSNIFDDYNDEIFTDDIHTLQKSKNIIAKEMFQQIIATFEETNFQKKSTNF